MSDILSFGAAGDGLTDDSEAIAHAVAEGDGALYIPPGDYRITRPIKITLANAAVTTITGEGGASRLIMDGPGPAIQIIGSHKGTGDPTSISQSVFADERAPLFRDFLIDGRNRNADGIELLETLQPTLRGLILRRLRHGIRLKRRNRNVLIAGCHVYHNRGAGVYFDDVNLHQININGCHISYNRLGGIRIERSEVRNLQITGNDIEYNNARTHADDPVEPTAEIYIDTTAPNASVNEVTVASNTIQATASPNGANLRILEKPGADRPPGLWNITGNVIGSQETNVHLSGVYGITLTGNTIYSCDNENLLIEDSSFVTIGANHFRRHTAEMDAGIRLTNCSDCVINGISIRDEAPEGGKRERALVTLERGKRIRVIGSQIINGVPEGVRIADCEDVSITHCDILEDRADPKAQRSISVEGSNSGIQIAHNLLERLPTVSDPTKIELDGNRIRSQIGQ